MRKKMLIGSLFAVNLGLSAFTYPGEEQIIVNCCKRDTSNQNFCCQSCCWGFTTGCMKGGDCTE